MGLHCQPVVAGAPLLLELTSEGRGDVPEPEGAHRGPGDGVGRGLEHAVDHRVHLVPVDALQCGIMVYIDLNHSELSLSPV